MLHIVPSVFDVDAYDAVFINASLLVFASSVFGTESDKTAIALTPFPSPWMEDSFLCEAMTLSCSFSSFGRDSLTWRARWKLRTTALVLFVNLFSNNGFPRHRVLVASISAKNES